MISWVSGLLFLGFWPLFLGFWPLFLGFWPFFRILEVFTESVFSRNTLKTLNSGPRNHDFSTPKLARFPDFWPISWIWPISWVWPIWPIWPIWPDLARFGQIRPDSARFGQIRPDSARFGQIRPDSARFLGFGPFWPGGVPVREFRPPLGGSDSRGGPRIGTNPVGVG